MKCVFNWLGGNNRNIRLQSRRIIKKMFGGKKRRHYRTRECEQDVYSDEAIQCRLSCGDTRTVSDELAIYASNYVV